MVKKSKGMKRGVTIFQPKEVWCAGELPPNKMDEVDEALYIGLCMGKQNEKIKEVEAVNE